MVAGRTKVALDGGTYPGEAKGGKGLVPPVGLKRLQGSSKGMPPVAGGSMMKDGEKGAVSEIELFEEFAPGAIKIPKAARIEVFGNALGCQAIETLGEKLL